MQSMFDVSDEKVNLKAHCSRCVVVKKFGCAMQGGYKHLAKFLRHHLVLGLLRISRIVKGLQVPRTARQLIRSSTVAFRNFSIFT